MAIQRAMLLLMGNFSRTTSTEALQVLMGCLPLDLEVVRSALRYFLRRGKTTSLGGLSLQPLPEGEVQSDFRIWLLNERKKKLDDDDLLVQWKCRWTFSQKGRTTYKFLPDATMGRRIVPTDFSNAVSRLVTGHGQIKGKWYEVGLISDGCCHCGKMETAEHIIFECICYEDLREKLWRAYWHTSLVA
uniref:Putative reverse transcriptase n=1 Tax=Panstrongylus lignarius TaxID=156445 RepID=A0A224XYK6_9HEMI